VIVLSMPVFVCILGRVFLKEACGVFHVIALTVTLVGIAFTSNLNVILGSSDEQAQAQGIDRQNELYGLLCGMGAALTGSSTYVIVRKVRHLPHSTILFNFSWVALGESLLLAYTVHDGLSLPTDPVVPWLLVLLGVFSFYGQMLLTRALQVEEAALVSVTRCASEVFFAFVFQVTFFRQMPTWFSVIGAALVTSAVMLTSVRKWVATLPASHWAYRCFWFTLK
jgi:drug/metabolite transporter (DMT)-like permease